MMSTKNISVLVAIYMSIWYFISCNDYSQPENIQKLTGPSNIYKIGNYDSSSNGGIYRTYSTMVNASNNYYLKILTIFLFDQQKTEQSYFFDQNDVVVRQSFLFYHGDSLLNRIDNPSPTISRRIKNNNEINILDNVILWAGAIDGKTEFFYDMHGDGGCNACSEAFYFYSKSGEKLWSLYSNKSNKVFNEKGKYEEIIRHFEISDSALKSKKIPMVYVFPPKYAGKITHATIR